jgi:hypothetical protein
MMNASWTLNKEGEDGSSPKQIQRRVQSMNDLNLNGSHTAFCLDVREACQLRRRKLEALRDIRKRRSANINLLLNGIEDQFESQTISRRYHTIQDFSSVSSAAASDRSSRSNQPFQLIYPKDKKSVEQNTSKSVEPVKRTVADPFSIKMSGDLRIEVERRRQQRLELFRKVSSDESLQPWNNDSNNETIPEANVEEDEHLGNDAFSF